MNVQASPLRLLTVGSLPPEWGGLERGGVATFHAALLEGFAQRDAEVEIVGVVPPAPVNGAAPVPVFARSGEVGIAEFYADLLARLEPDAVLMNHVAHTIGVTHARLDSPPPAIGVAHSWHSTTLAEPGEADRRRAVTEEALGGLAALVVGSAHALAEGQRLGLQYPSRAEAIHYPLQPLYLEPGIEVEAHDRCGALFLGSLIPRKNPGALVEAAALLPGLEATLAGEGELEGQLRESIAGLGLAGRVRVAGYFPAAEHLRRVRDLLLGAEVMCLPSSSESFGLAFIEALACGTPVIGFGPTVREIRDALGIEIGAPLDDPSPEVLAMAIEAVMSRSWNRRALRRAAVSSFDLMSVTSRYVDVIRSVVRQVT